MEVEVEAGHRRGFGRRWRWLAAAGALAVALYAAAGCWLAPWLVHQLAPGYLPADAGVTLSLGDVRVDPFRLRLEIDDARLDDGADAPLLAADHLAFDLELASLWRRAWVLSEARLVAPRVRAEIRDDGSLNLADLLPADLDPDAPWPDVRIGALSVAQGQVAFTDHSRPGQPRASLLPVEFHLQDFQTTGDGGQFRLQAVTEAGEQVAVQGRVSLSPYASRGRLDLKGLRLEQAQRFIAGVLPFDLDSGQVDLAADYRLELAPGQPLQLDVEIPRIDVRELAVRARGVDEAWLVVPEARVEGVRASLQTRELAIGAVHARDARLQAWLEPDGSLNLVRLLGDGAGDGAAGAALGDRGGWKMALDGFTLDHGQALLQDRTLQPAAEFAIDGLQVRATGLDQDLGRPLPVSLQARINGRARLGAEGTITPGALAADLQVSLEELPLQALAAYLPRTPGLRIRTGGVAGRGRLRVRGEAGDGPALEFEGDGSLSALEIAETSPVRPLLSWQRVDAGGVHYRMSPDALEVKRLAVHRPYARVVINEDGSINLFQALGLSSPSLPLSGASREAQAPKPVAALPAGRAAGLGSMPVHVARAELTGGTLGFADHSIEPDFQANVEGLGGRIDGLSTRADSVARIQLAGYVVNRHSPVQIQGESTVMAFDRHTDLRMDFRNIELPVFNPYSGRFAGYAINRGKLTTGLHYRIDDRALVADHHVVIDQLEWGQATDSKDKVSLPVRLGTSLLKDRNGVIDLQLPVTGSLDDPKFRIGPLVWQVLKNLVVKVVASPFAAIGSLFQGAEQAQYIDFAPGSDVLAEPARQGLAALAEALADKPELSLRIPTAAGAGPDAEALGESRFQTALASANGVAPGAWDYAGLDESARYKALLVLYRQGHGGSPEYPDEVDAQDSRGERKAARVAWLEAQLRRDHPASPAELSELAQRRAETVQEALLTSGAVDPARVFMVADLGAQPHGTQVRMELQLE